MKKKQNMVCGFIAVMFTLAVALATTACEEPEPEHIHQWGAWSVTTAATCTTPGSETRTCTLDATHKETRDIAINPNAHNYNWTVTKSATCTAGVETGVCRLNSSHTTTREIAPTIAHTFAAGAYLCSVCNNPGALGDLGPGGGKIFYVSTAGFTMTDDNSTAHYLEAAPADMATQLAWASSSHTNTDITGTAEEIGAGRKNTALILAKDASAPAAKACSDYNNGGKTDWFLPSSYELNQLYVNRTSVDNIGTYGYWSSSQNNSLSGYSYALARSFGIGTPVSMLKNDTTLSVRAVRAF